MQGSKEHAKFETASGGPLVGDRSYERCVSRCGSAHSDDAAWENEARADCESIGG